MPPRKRRALHRLHQPSRRLPIHVTRCANTDIPTALLHDDAKDNARLDADLSGLLDGMVDALNVLVGIAREFHSGFVDAKKMVEVLPCIFVRESGGRAGVLVKSHVFPVLSDVA